MSQPPVLSDAFRQCAEGVLQLHLLDVEDKNDSPEADAIRDRLDGPWATLSEQEKHILGGLSSDLYDVNDPLAGTPWRVLDPISREIVSSDLKKIAALRERGWWDLALDMLGRIGGLVETSVANAIRGEIWRDLGFDKIANEFAKGQS